MYVGVLVPLVPRYIEDELRGGELGIGLAHRRLRRRGDRRPPADRPTRRPLRPSRRDDRRGRSRRRRRFGVRLRRLPACPARAARADRGRGGCPVRRGDDADRRPQPARSTREAASYFSVAVYGGIGLGPIVGEAMLSTSGFRSAFALGGFVRRRRRTRSTTVPRRVAFATTAASSTPRPDRRRGGCIPMRSAQESCWPLGWPPSPCSAPSSRTTPGHSACPVLAVCSPCTARCASCSASAAPGSPSDSGRECP